MKNGNVKKKNQMRKSVGEKGWNRGKSAQESSNELVRSSSCHLSVGGFSWRWQWPDDDPNRDRWLASLAPWLLIINSERKAQQMQRHVRHVAILNGFASTVLYASFLRKLITDIFKGEKKTLYSYQEKWVLPVWKWKEEVEYSKFVAYRNIWHSGRESGTAYSLSPSCRLIVTLCLDNCHPLTTVRYNGLYKIKKTKLKLIHQEMNE